MTSAASSPRIQRSFTGRRGAEVIECVVEATRAADRHHGRPSRPVSHGSHLSGSSRGTSPHGAVSHSAATVSAAPSPLVNSVGAHARTCLAKAHLSAHGPMSPTKSIQPVATSGRRPLARSDGHCGAADAMRPASRADERPGGAGGSQRLRLAGDGVTGLGYAAPRSAADANDRIRGPAGVEPAGGPGSPHALPASGSPAARPPVLCATDDAERRGSWDSEPEEGELRSP